MEEDEVIEDGIDSCGSCGAAIGPCDDFPWHMADEDCRAIRKPRAELLQERCRHELLPGQCASCAATFQDVAEGFVDGLIERMQAEISARVARAAKKVQT